MSGLYTSQKGFKSLQEYHYRNIEAKDGWAVCSTQLCNDSEGASLTIPISKVKTDECNVQLRSAFTMSYGPIDSYNELVFKFESADGEGTPLIAHTDLFTMLTRKRTDDTSDLTYLEVPLNELFDSLLVATTVDYNLTFGSTLNVNDVRKRYSISHTPLEDVVSEVLITTHMHFNYTDTCELNKMYLSRPDVFETKKEVINSGLKACGFYVWGEDMDKYLSHVYKTMSSGYVPPVKYTSDFVKRVYDTLLDKHKASIPLRLANVTLVLEYIDNDGLHISYEPTHENAPYTPPEEVGVLAIKHIKCDIKDVELIGLFLETLSTVINTKMEESTLIEILESMYEDSNKVEEDEDEDESFPCMC